MYRQQGGDPSSITNGLVSGNHTLILILYVDDITIMGSSSAAVARLKSSLSKVFDMTDLGETRSYLGLHITRDRSNRLLEIDQEPYIKDVLSRFGFSDCNPTCTPLPSSLHLVKSKTMASSSLKTSYQQLIGSLLYAMIVSCPDIAYAVS